MTKRFSHSDLLVPDNHEIIPSKADGNSSILNASDLITKGHLGFFDSGTSLSLESANLQEIVQGLYEGYNLSNSLHANPNVNLKLIKDTRNWSVIKIKNISWDVSAYNIMQFLGDFEIAFGHAPPHFTSAIHIPLDKTTGKTLPECFVEFSSEDIAKLIARTKQKGIIKGRSVTVELSSQDELLKAIFPFHFSQSTDIIQRIQSSFELIKIENEASSSHIYEGQIYMSRDEISSLLNICKNFKLHYSRKCAERPFENIISILSKVNWTGENKASTIHRDHLFEMAKLSVDILISHLSKDKTNSIDRSLLTRLIRACLVVPKFTEKQKTTLLSISKTTCPADLVEHLNLSDAFKPFQYLQGPPGLESSTPIQQKTKQWPYPSPPEI